MWTVVLHFVLSKLHLSVCHQWYSAAAVGDEAFQGAYCICNCAAMCLGVSGHGARESVFTLDEVDPGYSPALQILGVIPEHLQVGPKMQTSTTTSFSSWVVKDGCSGGYQPVLPTDLVHELR